MRRHQPLLFFAGKDLLCALREQLRSAGFREPGVFREKILKAIEGSPEDVWTWLPEWNDLRGQIERVADDTGPNN